MARERIAYLAGEIESAMNGMKGSESSSLSSLDLRQVGDAAREIREIAAVLRTYLSEYSGLARQREFAEFFGGPA